MDRQTTFCAIPLPTLVYAGPRDKAEFDALALPVHVHGWQPDDTETLIRNDGQKWERRCHSKSLTAEGVMVIFQWFDRRPVEVDSTSTQPVEA